MAIWMVLREKKRPLPAKADRKGTKIILFFGAYPERKGVQIFWG